MRRPSFTARWPARAFGQYRAHGLLGFGAGGTFDRIARPKTTPERTGRDELRAGEQATPLLQLWFVQDKGLVELQFRHAGGSVPVVELLK